jgi:hypothetical protein
MEGQIHWEVPTPDGPHPCSISFENAVDLQKKVGARKGHVYASDAEAVGAFIADLLAEELEQDSEYDSI